MLEATIALNLEPLAYYFDRREPQPLYQRGGASQAYNLVCKDGKCLALHMSSPDKFWLSLCRAIGREDWMRTYAGRADRARDRGRAERPELSRTQGKRQLLSI